VGEVPRAGRSSAVGGNGPPPGSFVVAYGSGRVFQLFSRLREEGPCARRRRAEVGGRGPASWEIDGLREREADLVQVFGVGDLYVVGVAGDYCDFEVGEVLDYVCGVETCES